MSGSDDIARYLLSRGQDIGFHQGRIVAWDSDSGTNTVNVAGSTLTNVPSITSAGLISLKPGDNVAMLWVKSSLFIIGKVVDPGSVYVQPQWPIILYPIFKSNLANGTTGSATVNAGVLASWEGRILPALPNIEIDGHWGQASGSNTVTFELRLGGQTYGSWTISGGSEVSRKGPFDISDRLGQDWLKVELKISSSTGTGEVFFQPLGVYFRQS